MNHTRGIFCVYSAVLILIFLAMLNSWIVNAGARKPTQPKKQLVLLEPPETWKQPSFEAIATKHGTDKVTTHHYQFMYQRYLDGYRGQPIKLLEIGLGCNMEYGPGASYYTWLEYLPGVELYFIEFDAKCAEKYNDKTANAHVFTGDQADVDFLKSFAAETTQDGLFDVIIDDGGHTMTQQITSLENLWRIIKPGGYYFIEDLQTSYLENYGGDPSAEDRGKQTAMKYLYHLLDDMMGGWETQTISHELGSIECMKEICVLGKKKAV